MLDVTSEIKFGGILKEENFKVDSISFEAASRSLVFSYQGNRKIEVGEELVFYATNFKNPVNMRKKSGFKLTTLDS